MTDQSCYFTGCLQRVLCYAFFTTPNSVLKTHYLTPYKASLSFSQCIPREVIYSCLFAFSFSGSMLILLFSVFLTCTIERKIVLVGEMFVLNLLLLLHLRICIQVTLEGLWVR